MKKVLGLDLGTNSVGFALIQLADDENEGKILHMGSRIVPKDPNFHGVFEKGALGADSKNAQRRVKRGIRKSYQRWQGRRNKLIALLKQYNMLPDNLNTDFPDNELTSDKNFVSPAYELYTLRAKAATEQITLKELGRVLLLLNNKRGFKSNKKAQSEEEKETDYKKQLNDENESIGDKTIGQYLLTLLQKNPYTRLKGRTFYRKKYIEEFDRIWITQRKGREQILTGEPGKKDHKSLYSILKNDIIYFQRPLKSAKGLVGKCRYEKHLSCVPVSSPLFQHFRIWKTLNDLEVTTTDRQKIKPTIEQRKQIYEILHNPDKLNKQGKLTSAEILKLLGFKDRNTTLNFAEGIPGNKTFLAIKDSLETAGVNHPENLRFTWENEEHKPAAEKTGLNALWHIAYSTEDPDVLANALVKNNRFGMTLEQARIFAEKITLIQDFASLSAKAIRKLIPYLESGYNEFEACEEAGYRHSDTETKKEKSEKELLPEIPLIQPNELRNPIVEQILNQALQVVNKISEKYGKPDEVRIEMARSLRATAEQRKRITKNNRALEALNDAYMKEIAETKGSTFVTARDRERFKLWNETNFHCLYSGKQISKSDVFNGKTEIEHILPRSLFADNSLQNKILVYKEFNEKKGQRTAWDFIQQDKPRDPEGYKDELIELNKKRDPEKGKGISNLKYKYLLMSQNEIPEDFASSQLKATEYITKEAVKRLQSGIRNVTITSGAVTAILREDWGLNDIMRDINLPRYESLGKVVKETRFNNHKNENYEVTRIEDWSKRDDHRHHALDALVVALTTPGVINRINHLNASNGDTNSGNKKQRFPLPIPNIHAQVKDRLNSLLVSYKKSSKAVTLKKSKAKRLDGSTFQQETLVPRGSLHEDTILGKIKRIAKKPMAILKVLETPEIIAEPKVKEMVLKRLAENENDIKKTVKSIKSNNLERKGKAVDFVKVFEEVYTKRVDITSLTPPQVEKILDEGLKRKIKQKIGDTIDTKTIKAAFIDYAKDPIYLDDNKTIPVMRVSVEDNGELEAVRLDGNENPIGYAYLKNNHHALVHELPDGSWSFRTVSLWEATARAKEGLPVVDKSSNPEKKFVMSMQNNDLFFRISELEDEQNINWFMSPENIPLIHKNLFRVQKMSSSDNSLDIWFRNHLETKLNDQNEVRGLIWERVRTTEKLQKWIKIHIDNLGHVIRVGE
jgi:CRISPR-associated endonuclease Csn1